MDIVSAAISVEKKFGCNFLLHKQDKINGVFVLSAKSKTTGRWVAWTQKLNICMTANSPLTEKGPVYFDFGNCRNDAINNLIKSEFGGM